MTSNSNTRAAFGLSARAIDTSEFATIIETSECLFAHDNGGTRTYVLTDQNGMDFIAVFNSVDGNAVIVELSDAHESAHHHAREVLNRVF